MKAYPFLLFPVILAFSCSSNTPLQNEIISLKAELEEVKRERDELMKAREDAFEQYEKMRDQYVQDKFQIRQELDKAKDALRKAGKYKSSSGVLQFELDRLKVWAKALADGYGPGVWKWDVDAEGPLFKDKIESTSVEALVNELNSSSNQMADVKVVFKKVEGRTAYIGTTNDLQLTAGMGTYGANAFAQEVLYTLTSLPDIDCVYFDIEEGDHLAPGKVCR